jgi:PBP1b-binding outer membrane lipoprotein LpoB
MERHKIKAIIAFVILIFLGCAGHKPLPPKEVILRFESEIPVNVTIYKRCEGNWNFCKWE